MSLINKIESEAKRYFIGANGCHDWTHVDRVRNLALNVGRQEKANLFVIEIAALLHDIGRKKEMREKGIFCHAEYGAITARKILNKYEIDLKLIDEIAHCISTHRYRKGCQPETLEAKVLFDADKLDSIGAVGIARDFLFAGYAGSKVIYTGNEKKLAKSGKDYSYTEEDSALLEYEVKLKYIKNKIYTKAGKRIAKARHTYMADYFKRLEREIKGVI